MTFPTTVHLYSLGVPLAFAIFYWLRLRRLPVLNQFAALAICSVLLPFVSYDYTLVHMYAVFAAFLLYLLQDSGTLSPSRLTLAMICFALVFAPLAVLALEHLQGQVKGVALLVLLAIFASTPMPSQPTGCRA